MLLHKNCPQRFLPTVIRHTNTLYTQIIHEYLFPLFKKQRLSEEFGVFVFLNVAGITVTSSR